MLEIIRHNPLHTRIVLHHYFRITTRIKSPQVFERYSKRGLEQRSKEAFYEIVGQSESGLFGESE